MSGLFSNSIVAGAWKEIFKGINAEVFDFNMVKPMPDIWTEANIKLPENTSAYPGPFSYDLTPYCREIVNHFHPSSPVRHVAVMKGSQSGLTAGVVIPGICYIISQVPDPILFTAADKIMAGRTIAERLDPILLESGLAHLIRPHSVKKANQRTGDTAYSKEFAGGTLTALGTNNPDSFRFFHCKYAIPDDWETAPQSVGEEGAPEKLLQGRQKSYGRKAKTFYISTPKIRSTSNILKQYNKGTQKKWHWPCPSCGCFVEVKWFKRGEDGEKYGMVYELDKNRKLIKSSIHFRTECCKHLIDYKDKYDLNLKGIWVQTAPEPEEEYFESYYLNDIFIPPGFDDWEMIVKEWIEAQGNPRKLVAFNNQRLGLPFEELGEAPKSNALMENVREYAPGIVPDKTSELDGNGPIVLLTMACDLNGVMGNDNDDVRLDWEIVAHAASGSTYSVDHGSIGTFKRIRDRKTDEIEAEKEADRTGAKRERDRYTYAFKQEFSVWPLIESVIKQAYVSENGIPWGIQLTAVDTGHFEKLASQFVSKMQEEGLRVFGVKGRTEKNYRDLQKDTHPVRRSGDKPKQLYIIEVNQLKDEVAECMKLSVGNAGNNQPPGFMNFPQPNAGKYTYPNYFSHYEGERRLEVKNPKIPDETIGYTWVKKHSQVANHFWDVRVYNIAAPLIYLDLIRQSNPTKYKNYSWEDFVYDVTV